MDAWNSTSAWREKIFERVSMLLWKRVANQENNRAGLAYLIFKKSHSSAYSASFDPRAWEFQEFLTQETKTPYEREDDYICICVDTNQRSVDLDMPFHIEDNADGALSAHVEYKISNPLVALRATCDVIDEIKNRYCKVIAGLIDFSGPAIPSTNAMELELSRQNLSDIGMSIISAEILYKVDPTNGVQENQDEKDDDHELESLELEVRNFLDSIGRLESQAMNLTQNLKRQMVKFKSQLAARDTQIGELNTKIAEINNELKMSHETISSQQTNIQELDGKIASIEGKLDTANQAISGKERRIESLHREVEKKKSEITGMTLQFQTEIGKAQSNLSQTSEELAVRTNEMNTLNSQVQNIRAELQRSKSRVAILSILLALFFIALLGLAMSRH